MDEHTRRDSILTLKKLRDAHQSQLGTSVIAELEVVIAELEKDCDHKQGGASRAELGLRALEVISKVLLVVSNIGDWMNTK